MKKQNYYLYFINLFIKFIFLLLVLLFIYNYFFKNSIIKELFTQSKNINVILIGDSVLENSKYVGGSNESVFSIIKQSITNTYNFAQDGAKISKCFEQLNNIPIGLNSASTYVILSCGGNDILTDPESLNQSDIFLEKQFKEFQKLIESIHVRLPLAKILVLNLYYPTSSKYNIYKNVISKWNTMLQNGASKFNLDYKLLRLDQVINSKDYLTFDIEPSAKGSVKIADLIVQNIV